jgi:hypothetical protein
MPVAMSTARPATVDDPAEHPAAVHGHREVAGQEDIQLVHRLALRRDDGAAPVHLEATVGHEPLELGPRNGAQLGQRGEAVYDRVEAGHGPQR